MKLDRVSPFMGQIGAIYLLKSSLNPTEVAEFVALGPNFTLHSSDKRFPLFLILFCPHLLIT